MKYTVTGESAVVVDGGRVHVVRRGTPNFGKLRDALQAGDFTAARANLSVADAVAAWSSGSFRFDPQGALLCDGSPTPDSFCRRVLATLGEGSPVEPLLRFFERLLLNPSWRSVSMLFDFLAHAGIPLAPDGRFLAYKGVNADYSDVHSSTCSSPGCGHKTYINRVGARHAMLRRDVSDDPEVPCHAGFHVGSAAYARGFGARVVICAVDPADVVCVPKDCEQQKVRCCRYEVVGHFGDKLPSTLFEGKLDTTAPAEPLPVYTAEELMSLERADLLAIAASVGVVRSRRTAAHSRAALAIEILKVVG